MKSSTAAVIAATMRPNIGRYAARRLFEKLAGPENLSLYRLACQLQASRGA